MPKTIVLLFTLFSIPSAHAGTCWETYTDAKGVERRRQISCDGKAEPKPAPSKGEKKDPVAR
jgi:hypothetical protein